MKAFVASVKNAIGAMVCTPSSLGVGAKNFRKVFADGVRYFYFGWGEVLLAEEWCCWGGGDVHGILKENLKIA